MPLVAVAPALEVAGAVSYLRVNRLDAVGGSEAVFQEGHQPESVQGESVFQSLVETIGC